MVPTAYQQQVAADGLYRDANSLLYADNKPSDEAIDRVIGKINQEYVAGLNAFPALH
jgi:pre-mRNA-splicing factor SYF2